MKEHEFIHAINDNIRISHEAIERILSESIQSNHRKGNYIMISKKKIAVIAAAAALVLGATAFAANGVISSWHGSSSARPDYLSLPSAQECVKDAGFAPVLLERFSNGYTFENGNIVNNALKDEDGNSVEKFKSFSFRYTNGGDEVLFSQEKYHSEMEQSGSPVSSENGIDIYYNSYRNKVVPADYEKTEEDKKAEESGALVFSYGSDEIELHDVQGVSWKDGEMHYGLTQIDGTLSPEELSSMAKEIMAQAK